MSTPLSSLPKSKRVNINGVYVAPQEFTFNVMDVDFESGRTADGTMHRKRVGVKRKYNVSLPPCHTEDLQPILAAMAPVTFKCTFPDAMSASGYYTGTFYVGDRTVSVYNYAMDLWNSCSFDLVEI